MRLIIAFIAFYALISPAHAGEFLTEVPDRCLSEGVAPCLVQVNSSLTAKVKGYKLRLTKGTLFKIMTIGEGEQVGEIDLLTGRFRIVDLERPLKLNGYQVDPTSTLFVVREKNEMRVLDAKSLDFKNLRSEGAKGDFVLVKGEFLDRKKFVQFLASFSPSKEELEKDLADLSERYTERLNQEVESQTKVVQRTIASDELALEAERKRKEREALEKKKMKEMFFMRTFQR